MATMRRMKTELLGFSVLLIFLLLSSSLLRCCNSQATAASLSGSKVETLPGFDGALPFSLETGYIGVDEGEKYQVFYYFIESENNPKEDPLLVWLTGGPGCSSLTALFFEIGPITFVEAAYNGSLPQIILNQYSWTKMVSIIFVDMPVGTGFSYCKTSNNFSVGDFDSSRHINEFLRKWVLGHPKFKSNSIYVGGDSYSGIPVPLYFDVMSQGNEAGMEPFLNLKGYVLGNPVTDWYFEQDSRIEFCHGMGIISDELYEALQKTCKGKYYDADPSNIQCQENFNIFQKLIWGLDQSNILQPCFVDPKRRQLLEENPSIFEERNKLRQRVGVEQFSCRAYGLLKYWVNDESVQKALNIRKGSKSKWVRCTGDYYARELYRSTEYHANLSAKGFRSLIYSGDHDMLVPFIATQAWIRSLNYSIVDDWRQWLVDDQIAGYTRTYSNNMTFATVKGAGHIAFDFKSKECTTMFKRWLSGDAL